MKSLSAQLGAALFWISIAIGLLAAAASFVNARSEAWRFFDQQLRIMAHNVSIHSDDAHASAANAPSHEPEDDFVIQVWATDGQLVRIWPADASVPKAPTLGFHDTKTPVGKWRCFTVMRDQYTIQVSQRFEVRDELARDAAFNALMPIALMLPLTWLVLGILIKRSMSRLDRIGQDLLHARSNGAWVPPHDIPTEIWPFVVSVNRALSRSHEALLTQRRFVADAAHALRTPLAVLQTQLENLRPAGTHAESKERLEDMERGLNRATRLVKQLLSVSRGEAEGRKRAPVDLVAMATASISELVSLADRHRHDIGLLRSDPACVLADSDDIRMLLDNIIENAILYTPAGGVIDISIAAEADNAVVEIRDTGPGIPAEKLNRVLEPFYRATERRIEGSGLGLAIAATVAKRCGADLKLANRTDRSGLVVLLTFPLQSPRSA